MKNETKNYHSCYFKQQPSEKVKTGLSDLKVKKSDLICAKKQVRKKHMEFQGNTS